MKVPISLIVDDPAPIVSVYYAHHKTGFTADGREVIRNVPREFLFDFCDVIENRGIKGNFSVVPMPGNYGDIINGIDGVEKEVLDEWIKTVKTRVYPRFSLCPEVLTHNKAVDLSTGKALDMIERDWARTQNRTTLTPYIAKAFEILKQAGFDLCGITSPWDFGIEVEDEYVISISDALYEVYGKKNAWYFLRELTGIPGAKPWIALDSDGRSVVSIPCATTDHFWQTINTTDTSAEFINHVADELITEDGKGGAIVRVLETGGYPVFLTHWQSLVSNGLFTGLAALDEVARRINAHLSDKVCWMNFEEIMNLVLNDSGNYPKPDFIN